MELNVSCNSFSTNKGTACTRRPCQWNIPAVGKAKEKELVLPASFFNNFVFYNALWSFSFVYPSTTWAASFSSDPEEVGAKAETFKLITPRRSGGRPCLLEMRSRNSAGMRRRVIYHWAAGCWPGFSMTLGRSALSEVSIKNTSLLLLFRARKSGWHNPGRTEPLLREEKWASLPQSNQT